MSKKTGVLFVGVNGAVATTVIAGLKLIQAGFSRPRGMLTDEPLFAKFNLIPSSGLIFGGWDTSGKNAYQSALEHRVIKEESLRNVKKSLSYLYPYKAVISNYDCPLSALHKNVKPKDCLRGHLKSLINDIARFKKENGVSRVIIVDTSSAQKYLELTPIHRDPYKLEEAVKRNDRKSITSGILYALAAIKTGSPFIDFTSNRTLESEAIARLASKAGVPLAGKDGCTGQTLVKTVISHLLRVKNLRVIGWYSTNILGNNDGKVLSCPGHDSCKIEDKKGVLNPILGYNDFPHIVDINYYPPRGDNKEAWDNIDFLGWLDEPMAIKINFLAKDSILAAPLVVDLIRLLELAARRGKGGIQSQLSLFFKHPAGENERAFFKLYKAFEEYYRKHA